MADQDIDHRFDYHPPMADATREKHEDVRAILKDAARRLVAKTPQGREQALVVTKLEEAMFWANAAIARGGVAGPNPNA